MLYQTKRGDSPTQIARRYGVSFDRLIAANAHKPTTVVAGRRTWRSLLPTETISVPIGTVGALGDAASDAINALISAGGPCDQANAPLVCAAQLALGVSADGKWGNDTSTAARRFIPSAPPGCSPRPSWWAPKGSTNCTAAAAIPRTASVGGLAAAASAALAALSADPNYCSSVARVGSPVNSAVHNFKAAWNAANPSNPVPIGTGKYEPVVANALSSALGGMNVPPGCGATAAAPPPPPPPPPGSDPMSLPTPSVTPVSAPPSALQALMNVNPCDPSSALIVCAAQRVLGVSPDGKYGNDTATAARRFIPNTPPPCSPRPSWWTPKGQTNCTPTAAVQAATQAAQTAQAAAQVAQTTADPTQAAQAAAAAAQAAAHAAQAAQTATAAQQPAAQAAAAQAAQSAQAAQAAAQQTPGAVTTTEEKKGLSTGAIVAGAIGAAALVGLIVVAATGKKGHRGSRGPRGPAHRKSKRHGKKR